MANFRRRSKGERFKKVSGLDVYKAVGKIPPVRTGRTQWQRKNSKKKIGFHELCMRH